MKSLYSVDYLGLGVCAVLTGLMLFFGIMPMLHEQAAASEQLTVLDQKRAHARDLATTLSAVREQYTNTRRAAATNTLRLESVDRLNHRLRRITDLAIASGLELEQVEPSPGVIGSHYVKVPIRVSGRGDYLAVSRYLRELHEKLPDIMVSSIDLSGRAASTRQRPIFGFRLDWYAAPRR